jgi:hypothetical protein
MNSQRGTGRRRWLRAGMLPLVALLSALAIAACGGSSSSSTTKSTTSSTSTSSAGTSTTAKGGSTAERIKLQACLKKHGVTLPAGGFGGGAPGSGKTPTGTPPAGGNAGTRTFPKGTPPAGAGGFRSGAAGNSKFAKALKACGASFGGGAGGFAGRAGAMGGGGGTPQISATVLKKFVACVRTHGYPAMPEASTSTNSSGGFFPKRIETDPKFVKASKSCSSILQSGFQRPTAGGTSTTTTG